MARHITRRCPRCQEKFCVTISDPTPDSRDLPICARCADCGYALQDWRVIVRPKQQPEVRFGLMRKVFTR